MTNCTLRGSYTLSADGALHVLQITDTHLMAEQGGTLLNMDTDDSLQAVVATAQASNFEPHALLITGDIAGDGAADAYRRLDQAINVFDVPSFWLPGNHDGCHKAEVPIERFSRFISTPHWQIVMLNSQIQGAVGGYLAPAELDALSKAIDDANASDRHLLVALHHPLHPLGCEWLDPQRVRNGAAFFAEISRVKGTALVISGHVHQESDMTMEGVRYLTAPSTCVQFEPGQAQFKAHDIAPGYRWLSLYPDGRFETAVERVVGRQFDVDLTSGGYL